MDKRFKCAVATPILFLTLVTILRAGGADSAFSYQGQLKENGAPANGTFDFQFTLLAADGVMQVERQCAINVEVVNGLFQAEVEFSPSSFDGTPRRLRVGVKRVFPGGIHDCSPNTIGQLFEILSPLQEITATPYAVHAADAALLGGLDSSNFLQDIPNPLSLSGTSAVGIVRATNDSTANNSAAIRGDTTGSTGNDTVGVLGKSTGNRGFGVSGECDGPICQAVRGRSFATSGFTIGVVGVAVGSPDGRGILGQGNFEGVLGQAIASTGDTNGVTGRSLSTSGRGVLGQASANTGTTFAVRGEVTSPNGFAAFFSGPAGSRNFFERSVGIGTQSPTNPLHISAVGTDDGGVTGFTEVAARFRSTAAGHTAISIDAATNLDPILYFAENGGAAWGIRNDADAGDDLQIRLHRAGANDTFVELNPSGNLGLGTVGNSIDARLHVQSDNARAAKFDRYTSDGELIVFARNDSVVGTITNAGGTVSYNAFTGSHYAWSNQSLTIGALVSMTGDNRRFGHRENSEVVYGVSVTVKANDPACLGAYLGPMESTGEVGPENPLLVAAVGNGELCLVDGGGGDIEPGDYLISSDVAGCAMKDDSAKFPIGHVIGKAADRVRWKEVNSDETGVRKVRASVLFGAFVRGEETRELRERIARLEAALLQQAASRGDISK